MKKTNGKPLSHAQQAIANLDAEYPNQASRALARMAYKRHVGMWPNEIACLTMVRSLRGAAGNRMRSCQKLSPTIGVAGYGMPKARKVWRHDEYFAINGPANILVMSDIHVPFHDEGALQAAVDHGKKMKVDHVVLLGDAIDCHAISRWETNPDERDFTGEIESARGMFRYLRHNFPKARIILKEGNHEERYERYMVEKCAELMGIPQFDFASVFGLDDSDIELVNERRKMQFGKLLAIHGHEARFSSSVNPARGLWLKMKVSAMAGHLHRSSSHSERDGLGHTFFTYGLGCLCDLRPKYLPVNEWTQGFANVRVEKGGAWHCDNLKVIGGKVY